LTSGSTHAEVLPYKYQVWCW